NLKIGLHGEVCPVACMFFPVQNLYRVLDTGGFRIDPIPAGERINKLPPLGIPRYQLFGGSQIIEVPVVTVVEIFVSVAAGCLYSRLQPGNRTKAGLHARGKSFKSGISDVAAFIQIIRGKINTSCLSAFAKTE